MAAAQTMAMTTTQKIIAIAVTIIIISTVAVPVINDLSSNIYSTENNTANSYMATSATDLDLAITVSGANITVNGYTVTPTDATLLLITDKMIVFREGGGQVKIADLVNSTPGTVIKSLEASNGEYTAVKTDDSELTGTYEGKAYYISDKGNYGLYKSSEFPNSRFNADSDIHVLYNYLNFVAADSTTLSGCSLIGYSSIKDGTISAYGGYWTSGDDGWSLVEATAKISLAYVDNDDLTYALTGITASLESGGKTYYYTAGSPYTILAPIEYKVIGNEDSSFINLIGVIPILLFMVPLMLAVRMIALRRN